MRRLLALFTRRMAFKIFVVLGLVVGVSLAVLAWLQSSQEIRGLRRATRESAQQIADLVVGSVEHTMLQGDGIAVKQLIAGFKSRLPRAEIHIFDRFGAEVFGPQPAAPARDTLPPGLLRAESEAARLVDAGRIYRPIPNEERCHKCHAPETPLRGVFAFTPSDAVWAARREDLVAELTLSGFVHIMTARQSRNLDDFFAEIPARAPGIKKVAVYDKEGDIAFGQDVAALPRPQLMAALQEGAKASRISLADGAVQLVPLPMQTRCAQCHRGKEKVRGLLAIQLSDAGGVEELEGLVDTTLRALMMSSLGRLIVDYLREVATSGAVSELALYDNDGRTYFDSRPQPIAAGIAAALAAEEMAPQVTGEGKDERVMMTRRLNNEGKCITCHGDDHAVRGVVTVSLPNDKAIMVRENAIARTSLFSGVALTAILGLLFVFLSRLVDRPVRDIGAVAERVGQGDLTARVTYADPDGDEMRQLGTRINAMIHELRTKFVLEKYVSRGAAKAAQMDAARSRIDMASVGERRHLTILFSDIRGFTAFSETVPPETVVGMLNRFLQAQATVVEKWQGDIDKYVGDELMAVFAGPDAARRAVRCAVEMLEAVEKAKQPGQELAVGVGISSGDVVYGPIGSNNRLDFTVIGDVVNTGARLCSAAKGGQVICSSAVIEDCRGGLGDIEFDQLTPIAVKNKREPLQVYSASRVAPREGG